MRRLWPRLVTGALLAWLAGTATATLTISGNAREDFTVPDLVPIATILAVAGALLALAVALPALVLVRRLPPPAIALLSPLAGALAVALPAAAATGVAVAAENLPVGEAVLFTGALAIFGLAFGSAFVAFSGHGWARRRAAAPAYAILVFIAMFATVGAIPFVEERLLASAENGVVVAAPAMSVPRSAHTATELPDGRVLFAGGMASVRGEEISVATTEIYDPRTNTIVPGASMGRVRSGHTATLLSDGNVLMAGGIDERGEAIADAELYITVADAFVPIGPMLVARERHAATRLLDGRVLVTGGSIVRPSEAADLYDPMMRTFGAAAPMRSRRCAHSSTLLGDGRVLIAGGAADPKLVLRSVEIFDPVAGVFADAGSMQVKRYKHSATPMADGRVMLLGGSDELDWAGARRSVEIYDPASRRSQPAVSMNRARFKFPSAVAVAANGTLVVAGGGRRVEVFDLRQAQFSVAAGSLGDAWYYATATPLADGRVLIAGGYNESLDPTNRVWIYRPPGPTKNALSRHQQSMSGGT